MILGMYNILTNLVNSYTETIKKNANKARNVSCEYNSQKSKIKTYKNPEKPLRSSSCIL